jgi:hypothetical protein
MRSGKAASRAVAEASFAEHSESLAERFGRDSGYEPSGVVLPSAGFRYLVYDPFRSFIPSSAGRSKAC